MDTPAKNSPFPRKATLNCKGRILILDKAKIMGIINLTPDSFFDGGQHSSIDKVLRSVEEMSEQGATMIDIGGMSSRPGAEIIDVQTELQRVIHFIEPIAKRFPEQFLSIDTIRAEVAEEALAAGAHIVNDISGGSFDERILEVCVKHHAPVILMHMLGLPADMQTDPHYDDLLPDVIDRLTDRIHHARKKGVTDIVIDPGFGFGKTLEQNYQLLAELTSFLFLDLPILVGLSRKSMICKAVERKPAQALPGTIAAHTLALMNGASILRVHDVEEARQAIEIVELYAASKWKD